MKPRVEQEAATYRRILDIGRRTIGNRKPEEVDVYEVLEAIKEQTHLNLTHMVRQFHGKTADIFMQAMEHIMKGIESGADSRHHHPDADHISGGESPTILLTPTTASPTVEGRQPLFEQHKPLCTRRNRLKKFVTTTCRWLRKFARFLIPKTRR